MPSFSPLDAGSCTTKDVLEQFLSGQLPDDASESIAEHLEQCAACSETLREVSLTTEFSLLRLPNAAELRPHEMPARLRADLYGLAEGTADEGAELSPSVDLPGRKKYLGRFELRECLGRGAYGTVYLARDPSLQRDVALKIPRHALLDQVDRDRFLREGRTTGRLQHPNIVLVHEVGEVDGTCYLALAYCQGPTLAHWLAQHPGGTHPRLAAELVRKLAQAVAYAHGEGVLHRDLKPENVILEPTVRSSRTEYEPKLTDFGVAKLLDRGPSDTRTGVVIGTLPYMAPEQASGQRQAIGPVSDIYSLGVILYELLTGQVPHRGETQTELLRRILLDEPIAPRKIKPGIPRDLEAICLKCLEKDWQRRYQHAAELSDDLRRFLDNEPTQARPMHWPERARRWSVRNPSWTLLGVLLLFSLMGGIGGLLVHLRMLSGANQNLKLALSQARESERHTRHALYCSDLQLASQAFDAGDARHAALLLARHVPEGDEEDVRCLGWHWLKQLVTPHSEPIAGHQRDIYFIQFSPDSKQFATAGAEGVIRLFDAATKRIVREIPAQQGEVNGIAFHPTRPELASVGDDGSLCAWNLENGENRLRIAAHTTHAYGVRYLPDGNQLITCANDPVIKVWDAAQGTLLRELREHTAAVEAIALSPDGRWFASISSDQSARVWSLPDLVCAHVLQGHEETLHCLSFSPDSQWLATGGKDNMVRVWDVGTGEQIFLGRHVETVQAVAFSSSPPGLLSGDRSGAMHFWHRDPAGVWSSTPKSWTSDTSRVWSIAPLGDAGYLTAGRDGSVVQWSWPEQTALRHIEPLDKFHNFVFLPNDQGLLIAAGKAGLLHWNFQSISGPPAVERWGPEFDCIGLGLLANDKYAVASRDGWMRIYERASKQMVRQFDFPRAGDQGRMLHATSDPSTILVELQAKDAGLYSWHLEQGILPDRSFERLCYPVALAPDGDLFAASFFEAGDRIQLWNLANRKLLATLPGHTSSICDLQFSPDGRLLVSVGADRFVRLWDVAGRREAMSLIGHRGKVNGVAFSPQGDRFVTASSDGTLRLWDTASGRMLMILHRNPAGFDQIGWSSTGRYIAANVMERQGLILLDAGVAATTLPLEEHVKP